MYNYEAEKHKIFTEEGQRKFLEVYQKAKQLLKVSGAFQMYKVMPSGDTWEAMAHVDRLVELGEIVEVDHKCAGQHRVFVSAK